MVAKLWAKRLLGAIGRAVAGPRRRPKSRRETFSFELLESRELLDASGSLLVQLRDGASLPTDRWGLTAESVEAIPIPGWYEVKGANQQSARSLLSGDSRVARIEVNQPISVALAPSDPSYANGSLWGLNGYYGIKAPAAWDYSTGSTTIAVGIVDTGIDVTHSDLYKNIWINQGEIPTAIKNAIKANPNWDTDGDGLITFWDLNETINQGAGKIADLDGDSKITAKDILYPSSQGGWANGISEDGGVYVDDLIGWNFVDDNNKPYDDNGHGTHVAGTIGAMANNGFGVAGVNWKTQLQAIKILNAGGQGYDSDGALGIVYAADRGARVSNNSWITTGNSSILSQAVTSAGNKNSIVVAAAGNSTANLDTTNGYPAKLTNANLVSVAAIDATGSLAYFSNYGATSVDLGAPGSGILSTVRYDGFAWYNGTSMAAPHVAGAFALVMAQAPGLTGLQVKDLILSKVAPNASLAGRSVSGGILDLSNIFSGPEIQLFLGSTILSDNAATIDFGSTLLNQPVQKTLTVTNAGTQALALGGLTLPTGFAVVTSPPASLNPGQSASFTIRMTAASIGPFSGKMILASNDGDESNFRISLVGSVTNNPPVFNPIANQTISVGQPSLTISLPVSDPDGDVLSFSATILPELAHLKQAYGLYAASSYFTNYWGRQEKWIYGPNGAAYFLLPDGTLNRSASGQASGPLIATLDPSVYADPTKLTNPSTNGGSASFIGSQMTIAPVVGVLGKLYVTVSASDAGSTAKQSFVVTVINSAPSLEVPANQSMSVAQGSIALPFSAADADNQLLTVTASVASELAFLKQTYGLYAASTYYTNYWGKQEKWIYGSNAGAFFLLPDGTLNKSTNGQATGTLIANLDPSVYADPTRLTNPPSSGGSAVVNGHQVTVTPPAGFMGKLYVTLAADDGYAVTKKAFTVSVTNATPNLTVPGDQTMSIAQSSLTAPVSASDADNQPIQLTASLQTELAYLKQAYELYALSTYYTNYWGKQEKWIYGPGGAAYFLLPDGSLNRSTNGQAAGTLIANLDPSVYADPTKLTNPSSAGGSATIDDEQITVTPPAGFLGKLYVTITASDGFAAAKKSFSLTVTNTAPTLSVPSDQVISVAQRSFAGNVAAFDADNQTLNVAATLQTELAYLKQTYGLYALSSYYTNYWGKQEKWVYGPNGAAYFLLPDGALNKSTNGQATGTLIANLDPSVYADPTKLTNPSSAGGSATIHGGQITVTPSAGFLGKLYVTVSASDGHAAATKSFSLTVTNAAPDLTVPGDQTISIAQSTLTAPVSASDADNQNLQVTASIQTELAYLKQTYGLYAASTYYTNYWGKQEKWIYGPNGAAYFLLPDGTLNKSTNGQATGTLIANLDPSVYADPTKLTNPSSAGGSATIDGGQITVTPPAGFLGKLYVTVSATDGYAATTKSFSLTVANAAPDLTVPGDQTISFAQGSFTGSIAASDADNQPLSVSAAVQTELAYLKQTYGLYALSSYYTNYWGKQEKWVYGPNGAAYFLLPDGTLNKSTNGQATGTLIANLDPSVYADPTKLTNPPSSGGSANVGEGQITVTPPAGFLGKLYVTVSTTDGYATTKKSFTVTIINAAPTLETPGNQTMSSAQGSLTATVTASDADGPAPIVAVGLLSELAHLKQTYGLYAVSTYYFNYWGKQEKWIYGPNGAAYFLLPDGTLNKSTNGQATGVLIANLDPSVYADPTKLTNPAATGGSANLVGDQLTITPPSGFLGKLFITVSATDGVATTTKSFTLTVTA